MSVMIVRTSIIVLVIAPLFALGLVAVSSCSGAVEQHDSGTDSDKNPADSIAIGCPQIGCAGNVKISAPINEEALKDAAFTVCRNGDCSTVILRGPCSAGSCEPLDRDGSLTLFRVRSVEYGAEGGTGNHPFTAWLIMSPLADRELIRFALHRGGVELHAAERELTWTECCGCGRCADRREL